MAAWHTQHDVLYMAPPSYEAAYDAECNDDEGGDGMSPVEPDAVPSPLPLMLRSPEEAVRRVVLATQKKQANKLTSIRKNNSERARRYRKRKKEKVGHTLWEVETLRKSIAELFARRQMYEDRLLAMQTSSSNIALKLVQEYSNVFRYGMQAPPTGTAPVICSQKQEAFLETLAHPDIVFGEFVGVHPLIDQWMKYSCFHSSVRLELVSVRIRMVDDCPIVSTSGVLHLRYSRKTMEKLFPHALLREDLVQQLIGKEIHLRYGDDFYFNERGQMIRYELVPDLVSALHQVVGSLHDVSLLLGDALIEQDAVIKQDLREDVVDTALDPPSGNPPVMDIGFILS